MIRFQTLGAIDLRVGEAPVVPVLREPRLVALLAFLARADSPVDRVALRSLFWPSLATRDADAALDVAIEALRSALGDESIVSGGSGAFALAGTIDCDCRRFDAACEAGRWDEAIARYTGAFLIDLSVDDAPGLERWIEGERSRLRAHAEDAKRRVAESAGTTLALGGAHGRQGPHSPQAQAMTILTAVGVVLALVVPILAHFYRIRRP